MPEQFVMETLPLLPDERCVPDVPQGLGLLPMADGRDLSRAAADAMQCDETMKTLRLGTMAERTLRPADEPVWRGVLALALLADTWDEPVALHVEQLAAETSAFVRSALFACDCDALHLAVLMADGAEHVLGLTHSSNILTLPATGEDWRGVLPHRLTWVDAANGRLTDPCCVLNQRDRHVLCARLQAVQGSDAVDRFVRDLQAVDEAAMQNALDEDQTDWITAMKVLTGLSQEMGFEALEAEKAANVQPGENAVLAAIGVSSPVLPEETEQRTYLWHDQPFARTNDQLGLEPMPGQTLNSLKDAVALLEQYSRRYDRDAAARLGVWMSTAGLALNTELRTRLLDQQIALQQRSAEAPEPLTLHWPWHTDTPALQLLLSEFLGDIDTAPVLAPFADKLAMMSSAVLGDPVLDSLCMLYADGKQWKVLPPISAAMAALLTVRPDLRSETMNSLRITPVEDDVEVQLTVNGAGGQVQLTRVYAADDVLRLTDEQTPVVALWPSVPVDPARWKSWYLSLRGDVTLSFWQDGAWTRIKDLPAADEAADTAADVTADAAAANETAEASPAPDTSPEPAEEPTETTAQPDAESRTDAAAEDETSDEASASETPVRRFGSNRSIRRIGEKPAQTDDTITRITDLPTEEPDLPPAPQEEPAAQQETKRPACRVYETDHVPAFVALHQGDDCLGVLCYQAEPYQPMAYGEAVAALDLGASGVSMAMRFGTQNAQPVQVPSLWYVMLHGAWEDLPGEHLPVWPLGPIMPSAVHLFTDEGDEPFLNGMICPEEALASSLMTGHVPVSELLWRTDDEARRALRLLLREAMLLASFHAVMNGAERISWRVNLVQTMAQNGRKRLLDEVRAAANWCEQTTGLMQSAGSMAQQMKENISIAAYLREFYVLRGAYVLLNVGGSDAALTLWLRGMNKPAAESLLHLGVNTQLMAGLNDNFNYLLPDFANDVLPEQQLAVDPGADMNAWSQRRLLLDHLLGQRLADTSRVMNQRFWQGSGTYTQALLLFGFAQLFTLAGSALEQAGRNTMMNDYLPPEIAICLCGRGSTVFSSFDPAIQQALMGFARMAMSPEHPVRNIGMVMSPNPKLEAALGLAQMQNLPEPAAATIGDVSESRDVLYLTAQFLGTFAMQFPQSAAMLLPGLLENDGMFSELAEERVRQATYQSRGTLPERFTACVEQIRSLYAADVMAHQPSADQPDA